MIQPHQIFSVVPAWFSSDQDEDQVRELLSPALQGAETIAPPSNHFIYLDGIEQFESAIQKTVEEHLPGATTKSNSQNKGKGAGIYTGLKKGLKNSEVQWIVFRDADGDHRAYDFIHLKNLADQIQTEKPDSPILVIGGRTHLEPPLSYYRAAYEKLLNNMIQASVQFHLARHNYIQDKTYFNQYQPYPDIQSGYKLYNRKAAENIIHQWKSSDEPMENLYRWGAEIPPYVWTVLQGGIIGESIRTTFREQPVTAYASIKRAEFYATRLVWVLNTCGISLWNAARIIDNELINHPLMFDALGRTEFLCFRKLVLEKIRKRDADEIPPLRPGPQYL